VYAPFRRGAMLVALREAVNPVRILHIVYSCIPGEFRGGVPRVVHDLACAQSGLGDEVTIYTTDANGTTPSVVPAGSVSESHGVPIHHFRADEVRWFRSADLRRALLDSKPRQDVIHSHNTFLALNRYAAEAHDKWGIPLFYHVHGALDPLVVNRGWRKRLRKVAYIGLVERRNLNRADGIFALTDSELKQIRTYGVTAPISVVSNGIWLADSLPAQQTIASGSAERAFRERFGIQADQQVILYLGRMVPKKGVHVLLEAFAELHQGYPDVILVLAGNRLKSSSYIRCLEELIREHHLETSVRWTGFLNESEKGGAWAAATLFSHVSESEGMAMSVLEAMAAGLPVIVSRECYMSQGAAAGALVEIPNDARQLCTAMESLLDDAPLRRRIGETARAYVREHHAWPQIAGQIVRVYEQALAARAGHRVD
jgi:glycosyltransferase involved in cell wall biosynthesis